MHTLAALHTNDMAADHAQPRQREHAQSHETWWHQRRALAQGAAVLSCRQTVCDGQRPAKTLMLKVGGIVPGHGGIGACIQLSLRAYMDALPGSRGAIDFEGGYKWYTSHAGCAGVSPSYACYTMPLVTTARCTTAQLGGHKNCGTAPTCDAMCWWGVLHARAFRPAARLLAAESSARARWSWWRRPHIALHLRRGDKLIDKKSLQWGSNVSVAAYADAVMQLALDRRRICGPSAGPADVFIASDSSAAVSEVTALLAVHASLVTVRNGQQSTTTTQHISEPGNGRGPVEVGFLGGKLTRKVQTSLADEAYLDIHLLSQATALVGLCMSQVSRVALLVGGATGRLLDAVAMDPHNIDITDRWKHGRAEGWRATGASSRAHATWRGTCEPVSSPTQGNSTAPTQLPTETHREVTHVDAHWAINQLGFGQRNETPWLPPPNLDPGA